MQPGFTNYDRTAGILQTNYVGCMTIVAIRNVIDWWRWTAMNDWQDRAACLGTDINIFFPPDARQTRQAYQICAECPVQHSCRQWANRYKAEYGIWAGHIRNPKLKFCPDCKQELPTSAFTQGQRGSNASRTYCRDCHNSRTRQYRKVTA